MGESRWKNPCFHSDLSRLEMSCRQEERVEQLRSFSFLSGVVAGFAVAALLQLEVDVTQTSQSFQIWFSVSAGLCVSVLSLSPAHHAAQSRHDLHAWVYSALFIPIAARLAMQRKASPPLLSLKPLVFAWKTQMRRLILSSSS